MVAIGLVTLMCLARDPAVTLSTWTGGECDGAAGEQREIFFIAAGSVFFSFSTLSPNHKYHW